MNAIQKLIVRLDFLQRKRPFTAFSYAVIKKYGEDEVGYQAALLTYYTFLSLFPLLLLLTTVTQLIATSHPGLQAAIIRGTTSYFPVLGGQLSGHVHSLHRSGLALIIGILFTFYGARGVADAFRHGVNHIWQVPIGERDGFPKAALKSLSIMIVGGFGFIVAAITSSLTSSAGHELVFRLLSLMVNVFILFWVFNFLLNISLPHRMSLKNIWVGAAAASIGLVVLQSFGTYLLARELKNLDALYSYFALALGLLFWIYLQAQILCYAIEIAAVRDRKLWPRSLSGQNLTKADKRATNLRIAEVAVSAKSQN